MKTVVVGLGPMGRRLVDAAKQLDLDIRGLCDKNPESIGRTKDQLKLTDDSIYFGDALEMFSKVRPEVAIIATNSDSHCQLTEMAVSNGASFVLCEKPMASSIGQCRRMIDACRDKGAALAINHGQRNEKTYTMLAGLVDEPRFGGSETVSIISGNSGMAMNGSHFIEIGRMILKSDLVRVSGMVRRSSFPNPRGAKFEDSAGTLMAESADGKQLTVSIVDRAGYGVIVIVMCRQGMIVFDMLKGQLKLNYRADEHRGLPPTRYGMPPVVEDILLEPEDLIVSSKAMLSGLMKGDPTIACSAEDAMNNIRVLAAAHFSSENGGRVVDLLTEKGIEEMAFPWP